MKKLSSLAISPLESHLGFWLRFVSNQVSGQFRREMESRGVSVPEWVALRSLYQAQAAASDLMNVLGMTKGAISKILSRLEEKNLIERVASESDRRAQDLQLTAAGRKLVPLLAALADSNDAFFFGHLSARERELLMKIMQDFVKRHQLTGIPVA